MQVIRERNLHAEFLKTSSEIVRFTILYGKEKGKVSKYDQGALDYYVSLCSEKDYFKQSLHHLSDYSLLLKHFLFQGNSVTASILSKYLFSYCSTSHSTSLLIPYFEKFFISLSAVLARETLFVDLFPVPLLYDN